MPKDAMTPLAAERRRTFLRGLIVAVLGGVFLAMTGAFGTAGAAFGPRLAYWVVVMVLGGLWGSRLALHLWHRVRSEPEDGRYQHLRRHWNGHQGKIFGFFQFQALLIVLFALPFVAVSINPQPQGWGWLIAAVAMWLLSVSGESIADRQLARFRANPANKGKTCRDGLWRYSRHPNYFFEWLHWFTYVLLAVQSPLWWLAWSGPLVMYVFLRWVSGIPFTEAQALRSRGEDYREYQRTTPMLFPWFPSRSSHARKESSP